MRVESDFTVMKTDDYGMFRKLEGNRDVHESRVSKIEQSVDEIGQVPSPIIVNERNEIIDGQGRFELFKRRGMPVYYMVVPGLGRDACIAMNRVTTQWSTMDFIDGFANDGNESYLRLKELINRYGTGPYKLTLQIVICASTGLFGSGPKACRSGDLYISERAMEFADSCLAYVKSFVPRIPKKEGYNKTYLYMALVFAYRSDSVDNESLKAAFSKPGIMAEIEAGNYSNPEKALKSVTDIYNNRKRQGGRVHLDHEYVAFKESGDLWVG